MPLNSRSSNSITDLQLEEIKSEFQRTYLLIILFIIIFIISTLNFLLLDDSVATFYGGVNAFVRIELWIVGFLMYQLFILLFLKNKIRVGQKASYTFKIIHTMVEISFPSTLLLFMLSEFQMLSFIESPVVLMYFLLIILSILHLDFRVSFLAGLLAAIHYALLTYYGFNYLTSPAGYQSLVPENSHYVRTVILVLCGGAAGFVARELKNRVVMAHDSLKAKNELEELFGQHVSREVSKALMTENNISRRPDATIMFLDIRNFTSFADSHTADEVVDFQNKFFSPVIDIINQHQGVVLQILGDGIMACFGTPVENTLHADMAFQASLQILKQIKEASDHGEIYPTTVGIGLHSGEMIVGTIGNEQRKQFSISGTPVIVASRIEQLNKKFSTQFLISGEVYKRITPGKVDFHFLGEEILKGIEKPVSIYSVVFKA